MSEVCYVATRKGLLTFDRATSGKWDVRQVDFLGVPVSMMLRDRRHDRLYAALDHGHFGVKLHRSTDDGRTWQECGVPEYPEGAEIGPHPMAGPDAPNRPASLKEIWALETGGPGETDLLWAGTIPGGLFRSRDAGESWELIGSLWDRPERIKWFGGGKDEPGIHSVCVDPRDPQQVRIGVSCAGVWTTTDGGQTWACQADGMRAEFVPPDLQYNPGIQDVHRLVQCPAEPDAMWVQHHNGIFKSTDCSRSWQEVSTARPSAFGFAVAVHPRSAGTAWFVPGVKDECRVPVDGKLVVSRTTDGGDSFEVLSDGLPQQHAYDIVFRHALDVDDTGRRLAMGSSTGGFWISEDGGDSWQTVSTHLPPIYCLRFA